MIKKIEYNTDSELTSLINNNNLEGFRLIEIHNLTTGNFVVFTNEPKSFEEVLLEETKKLEAENRTLMLALAEQAEASASETAELKAALAELAEIVTASEGGA